MLTVAPSSLQETHTEKNTATYGGALYLVNSTMMLTGNRTFQNNSANNGEAFYAPLSILIPTGNSIFNENSALFYGGVLYASQSI